MSPTIRTAVGIILLLACLVLAWPLASEMNESDRCKASGGSYDYTVRVCDFKASHPSPGLWQQHGTVLLAAIALGVAGCALLLAGSRE